MFNPHRVKLGKAPANIPHNLKLMSSHFDKVIPDPPAKVIWSHGQVNWGEMLNDKLGCCTCSAVGHAFQIWTLNEKKEWTSTDTDILHLYESATGYDPKKTNSDNGAECGDILNFITKHPFCGWTLAGYGLVKWHDEKSVKQAIWQFGGLYIGVELPKTCQGQDIWDVVDVRMQGDAAKNSWGGHCVFVCDYDADGVTVITWGTLQKMTWAFWHAYVDEAYAILSNAWVMKNQVNPLGFSKVSLVENMQEIMSA